MPDRFSKSDDKSGAAWHGTPDQTPVDITPERVQTWQEAEAEADQLREDARDNWERDGGDQGRVPKRKLTLQEKFVNGIAATVMIAGLAAILAFGWGFVSVFFDFVEYLRSGL